MNTEQLRAEFEALESKRKGFGPDTLIRASIEPDDEYLLPLVQSRWEGYQAGRAALQSKNREDAERLQAMAAEWDRARRGGDSRMPIWFALCDAIGSDADGAGMREAIDHARRIEGEV